MSSSRRKAIDRLAATVNPRARIPKGFGLWSEKMILVWLRQNQKPKPSKGR